MILHTLTTRSFIFHVIYACKDLTEVIKTVFRFFAVLLIFHFDQGINISRFHRCREVKRSNNGNITSTFTQLTPFITDIQTTGSPVS